MNTMPFSETEKEALEQFEMDWPGLGASIRNGALPYEVRTCKQCESLFVFPLATGLFEMAFPQSIGERDKPVPEDHTVSDEEKEPETLHFCSKSCHIGYLKENKIGTITCDNCDESFFPTEDKDCDEPPDFGSYYESAWDDEPVEKQFCSEECRESYETGDPGYFYCEFCNRMVITNIGYNSHYRHIGDETMCIRCYQDMIFTEGIERETFEQGEVKGMFFSGDNHEPIEAGFEAVEGFDDFFLKGESSIKRYCDKAIELIDAGYLVITGYEHLGLGGGEGYVTMFAKKNETKREQV